jgi:hypothetical protein
VPWLPRLAVGAAVALATGVVLMLGVGAQDRDRAAATHHSHVVVTDEPRAAPVSEHEHGIDPVSAGLLLADGITVLAVVVLLMRRPRRSAPSRR